ncbi:phage tail tape measure protein [Shouchella lehensis]|uniref:Metalloprotease n=1 Tax=Shouchella lehensis G1 TaxID=1246626 RepID=A0A060LZ15_9BACI|nr:phage tail tape measure protein [Shouchella lehensis]AIC95437.1 metalloprotease [Shouchella lehensis G1]
MFGNAGDATVLKVGWDASAVDSGVSNLNSRLSAARSELNATGAQMGGFGRSTDGLKRKQEGLNKVYELQGQKVKDLEGNYKRLVEEKGAESKAAIDASRHYNNALAEYAKMEGQLKSLTNEIAYQESAWSSMESGLNSFSSTTGKMADGFSKAGQKMTLGLTLPIVGVGTMALKTGIDFEKSMSKVQALSGGTAEEMAKMEGQAKSLGETTVFSASQAAEAQAFLAMAGWDVADIYEAMPGLLNLAAAGQMELGRTADITSNIMQAFGLKAKESAHVSDVLAAAASNSNTNIEQLGEAMEYAGPTSNVFGWSVEQTTAAIMKFGDAGIQGGKAGQAWSTSLQRLSRPTSRMAKMMENLNIQFFDAEGVMKPLPDLVGELETATKGMTDEQRANVVTTLFGNQAFKHWAILMEEGSDGLRDQTKALEQSTGAAQDMADTMLDNAYGSIIELTSAAEGLAIQFAEHMIPHFITLTEKATDLVRWFGNLDKDTQKYILVAAGIAAVLGPAAIALSVVLRSVSYLSAGLAKAVGAFGRYTTSAKVAQTTTTGFGASAQLAGTQVATANRGMGRFGRTLGGVGTAASLAGVGMLAFGDDSNQGLGMAMLFGPQIIGLGGKLLTAGKNALTSGGRFLGMGNNATTAGKGIGGLVRGVGALGKGAGALGGPIGLGVAAITTLGVAGYEVYEHYQDKVLPTLDSFGDIVMENGEKVSDSTAKQLDAFKKLHDDATVELNGLAWGSQKITDDMASSLTGKFSEMGTMIKDELNKNYEQSQSDLEKFLGQSTVITADHQEDIKKRYDDYYRVRVEQAETNEGKINDIINLAAEENRAITDAEQKEINRIKDVMMRQNVNAVTEGSIEQKAIMEQLKNDSSVINAQQATDTVKKAIEAKDGAIAAANEKYDEIVQWAITQRDDTGLLSEEEATKIIREAGYTRDRSITAAEEMHKGVVEQAKLQAEGHVEQINWQSGEVKSAWRLMTEDLLKGFNWVGEQINKVIRFFGGKEIPTMQSMSRNSTRSSGAGGMGGGGSGHLVERAYATGTSATGHPVDSDAIVSEKGPELIHDPKVGTYVTGNNGPERVFLHKGSSVLPAHHTKSLLNQYGFGNQSNFALPAYESGVGNTLMGWWESLIEGPKALIDKAISGLAPDWVTSNFIPFGEGVIKNIATNAVDYVKNLFSSGDLGEGGGGFTAGGGFPGMRKTSGFGYRTHPVTGQRGSFHGGVDYAARIGTPIPSQSMGMVVRSSTGWNGGYGNLVVVQSGPMQHYYAHNSRNLVSTGQPVAKGQHIALIGSTGSSTGPHVHYEQRLNGRRINPRGYEHGGISRNKQLAWLSEKDHEEYIIPSQATDRSLSLFSDLGEKLGVFNTIPSVDSYPQAKANGRSLIDLSALTGKLDELIRSVKDSDVSPVILVKLGEETIYKNVGRKLGTQADTDALWGG